MQQLYKCVNNIYVSLNSNPDLQYDIFFSSDSWFSRMQGHVPLQKLLIISVQLYITLWYYNNQQRKFGHDLNCMQRSHLTLVCFYHHLLTVQLGTEPLHPQKLQHDMWQKDIKKNASTQIIAAHWYRCLASGLDMISPTFYWRCSKYVT